MAGAPHLHKYRFHLRGESAAARALGIT